MYSAGLMKTFVIHVGKRIFHHRVGLCYLCMAMGNALSQGATIRKCRKVRTLEAVLQCVRLDTWSVVAVLWVATLATKAENGVRIFHKPVHRNSTDRPVGA